MMKKKIILLIVLITIGISFSNVHATIWDIQKDISLYGNLDQEEIDGNDQWACGPTSVVNSFVYLQNRYPTIYDNKLVPDTNGNGIIDIDEMTAIGLILASSDYMNTDSSGTWYERLIYGKSEYIKKMAPGSTIYTAQSYYDWTHAPVARPDWVEQLTPAWNFLYDELVSCEDIEILINGDWNHYLTLTSFHWDDDNNNGLIEAIEDAWIDYIDPLSGQWGKSNIWQNFNQNNRIETDFRGGTSWISMAVAESPVPEPETILLMGFGLIGFARGFRKMPKR